MIKENLDKAKQLTHAKRREKRAELFKWLDIQATIPIYAARAEADRQTVRSTYAVIQTAIDEAADIGTLKSIAESLK